MNSRGFTIIELVMVIILIAVVLAVSVSLLSRGWSGMTITAMAKKLRSDTQYAQEIAMIRRASSSFSQPVRARITFDTTGETYNVKIVNDSDGDGKWGETSPAEWEYAKDPSTGGNFIVTLNTGSYNGIVIDSASFAATGCTPSATVAILEFDSMGIPYCVDNTAGTSTKTDSQGSVSISKASNTATVNVTQNTGRASIP